MTQEHLDRTGFAMESAMTELHREVARLLGEPNFRFSAAELLQWIGTTDRMINLLVTTRDSLKHEFAGVRGEADEEPQDEYSRTSTN